MIVLSSKYFDLRIIIRNETEIFAHYTRKFLNR